MSTNTLIGTFSSIDINSSSNTTINPANLICIDTSNNRIGINTMDPSYSISIVNNQQSNYSDINRNGISTPRLYIIDISRVIGNGTMLNNTYPLYQVFCDQSGYLRMR